MGGGWWWWRKPWAEGDEGGIQAAWWPGGEEAQKGLKLAGGEQAAAVLGLPVPCSPSEARSVENMARASGKLGGVAGVLLGVHICWERTTGVGDGGTHQGPHQIPRHGMWSSPNSAEAKPHSTRITGQNQTGPVFTLPGAS